ncbi:hypothetical protein, partial [Nitrobacter winogradskyi]|uniref:hypothetical protein n=1 Tax=Nitrobacter winogradskyi TaxID=913 RepID=UPI001AED951D
VSSVPSTGREARRHSHHILQSASSNRFAESAAGSVNEFDRRFSCNRHIDTAHHAFPFPKGCPSPEGAIPSVVCCAQD